VMIVTSAFIIMNEPLGAAENDGRIESRAKQTYVFKTILKDDSIRTVSKEGVVLLTGTVAVSSHKSLAGETLRNMPGVISVDNQLRVLDAGADGKTDLVLTANVETALLMHRQLSATGTEAVVEAGVVSLRGEASSMSQKVRTAEYVKDIEGVIDVKNEITIGGKPSDAGEAAIDPIDDASITALVKEVLRADHSTAAMKIGIETLSGVVTISGPVKTKAERSLISKLVADINGVLSVSNKMALEAAVAETNFHISAPQNFRIVSK